MRLVEFKKYGPSGKVILVNADQIVYCEAPDGDDQRTNLYMAGCQVNHTLDVAGDIKSVATKLKSAKGGTQKKK